MDIEDDCFKAAGAQSIFARTNNDEALLHDNLAMQAGTA
jgi:hypothetical protein